MSHVTYHVSLEIIAGHVGGGSVINGAYPVKLFKKKSRIQETKHLPTNADSSTDAIGGWTKNTPKPNFFEKRKKLSKRKNSKTSRDMPKLAIHPSTRGL